MGEVVVSGEERAIDMQVDKAVEENRGEGKKTSTSTKDGSYSAVRWERFLPSMVIRVLLVEADDSTRHIISALLRKCSYKVAAVADGLKAWEVLKGRPHNIDLILTEVELPSISGFALLTLVMEHEICRKIPVIMMSSQDSVSTVYKCMLRGAADFLVKPVRINELRNVWQHVWRRQSSSVGASGPQVESVARQEAEATAENNAAASASDRPGGSKAFIGSKKGSGGDQSSCTKPDMEAESAYVKENEYQSQLDSSGKYLVNSPKLKGRSSNCDSLGQNFIQQRENVDAAIRLESNGEVANMCADVCHKGDDVLANPAKEAIDLIGTFGNHVRCSHGDSSSNQEANKPEFPHLDLSLRRLHIAAVESPEKQTLYPSIGSAFSRYVSKNPQLLHPTPVSVCGSRDDKMNSGTNHMSDDVQKFKSSDKAEAAVSYHGNTNAVSTSISPADQRAEVSHSHTRQNVFHIPFPVTGISLDGLYAGGYGSFIPPDGILCALSAKQNATNQLDPCTEMNQLGHFIAERSNNPEQKNCHSPLDHRTFSNNSNGKQKTSNNLEIQLEERTRFSSACTDQSASSSFCNNNYYYNNGGGVSNRNSFGGCGSVCASNNSNNLNSSGVGTAGMRVAYESGNEDINHAAFPTDANYLRSIQREAALTKFRLKRKERCFDKKVRYESRKKLAEQRPRVKGQFVRQVFPDLPPAGSENFLS